MTNYVFILDLDGTIIGDCIYQSEIYKISLILNKLKIKIKINDILDDYYNEKSKLIRPDFIYFMETVRKLYTSCLFYIYTASEKKWAEKEIGIIEKNLNIKFDRPIFTRNDCIEQMVNNKIIYKKSIEAIKRKIKVKDPEIIIIDDNDVYLDNTERLIKCKSYNYKYFCNYWDYIPIDKIKNSIFINYLTTLINAERLNPIYRINNMKQKMDYYKWLYEKCMIINKNNRKYKEDNFWLNLTKIIVDNKIHLFIKK
jgi:ribosomal protein L31E